MNTLRISCPSGYAPAYAIGFAGPDENYRPVSEGMRLPVATSGAAPEPLVGVTSVSTVAGPFRATADRVVTVSLTGTCSGSVRLLRSTDGGQTRIPLRVGGINWGEFAASGCEQVWTETEEGACFFMEIALASGSVAYRVSQ